MQDTTQLQAPPAGRAGFPPPPPARPVRATPPNQINQAGPQLPHVTPNMPRPAAPLDPGAFNPNQHWAPMPSQARPKRRNGGRGTFKWMIVLALLGGATYTATTYGSDLMKLATGDDSIDEPSAPLVFPATGAAPTSIRTATFTVERPDAVRGLQRFQVTTDFEAGVAQVVIERTDAPNLEVLTVFDQAFVRRVDEPTWYQVGRGPFPIDSELGVARWVRSLDQLLPPAVRQSATIGRATRSTVGTEPTTRLLLSIDPEAVGRAVATPAPIATDATAVPTDTPVQLAPGLAIQAGVDDDPNLTMEIWIDAAGIVRKSIMPVELGAETITVTSVSSEPWQPIFPTPEMLQPLTASSLLELGL